MRAIFTIILISAGFLTFGQTEITKIKTKNFLGTWYAKERLTDIKTTPVVNFYKTPPAEIKDSIGTIFNVYKDYIQVIKKNNTSTDTSNVDWFFVKESKNFKITEKVNTGQKMAYTQTTDYGSTTTQQDVFIKRTITFHLESLTEEKMILKYTK